jgi:leader peptidase (prepilin peptidase)/N-methyltransferase
MLERQWAAECADLSGQEPERPSLQPGVPRSRCPQCGHVIRWYENIPVLSWLALRGKCSQCGTRSACAIRWSNSSPAPSSPLRLALGPDLQGAGLGGFRRLLICLFLIDWDTRSCPTT